MKIPRALPVGFRLAALSWLLICSLVTHPAAAAPTGFMSAAGKFLRKDVDVITVTDVTEAGKLYPTPSPARPVRYRIVHLGARSFGGDWAGEEMPSKNAVLLWLMAAMRDQGLVLADSTHAPEVTLVFGWGMLAGKTGEPTIGGSGLMHIDNGAGATILAGGGEGGDLVAGNTVGSRRRALRFLGGDKVNLMWEQQQNAWMFEPRYLIRGMTRMGVAGKIWDFAEGDLFLGAVAAYPADYLENPKAPLLWQTRFACPATGLSLTKALPQMILAAAPNLGRETALPVNVNASDRFGSEVRMGDFTILNEDVDLAGAKINRPKAEPARK